jgi:hypothetical protein
VPGESLVPAVLTQSVASPFGCAWQMPWLTLLLVFAGACNHRANEPISAPALSPSSTTLTAATLSPSSTIQLAPARVANPEPNATPLGASRAAATTKAPELAASALPIGTFVATWVESNVPTYATLDIAADGVVHGTPFGAWQSLIGEDSKATTLGSLREAAPCATMEQPPFPDTANLTYFHLLSMPTRCISLDLASRRATKTTLQWYGRQPKDHSIAVLRPETLGKRLWLLVLADTTLSPAGTWLALTTADLDGDGLQDIAFVAQGVDGCDRGPCPLFWIDILMSRTHTVMRGDSSILLRTDNFEQKMGITWWEGVKKLVWHGGIDAGHYRVTATAGKRKLTWSVLVESNELVVIPGSPLAASKS